METPSASEILNFRVDPEQGGEVPVPLLKENSAINQLNINARYSAENKWRKHKELLDNLKDVYKDINAVNQMDLFNPDRAQIQKETQDLYKSIKDPRDIYSPETQAKIGELTSKATKSKQHNIYDFAMRQFLARNPELDTKQNRAKLDDFYNKGIDERTPYTLGVPAVFDPTKLADEIFKDKEVAIPFATSNLADNGQTIHETAGTEYLREPFLKKWNKAYGWEQEIHGRPVAQWAQEQFDQLNPTQQGLAVSPEKFWEKLGEDYFGEQEKIRHLTKDDRRANSNYDSPLEKFKAQTGRISANASAQRAGAYAAYTKRKLDQLKDEDERNAYMDEIYKRNLTQQPSLTTNEGAFGSIIPSVTGLAPISAENSLPIFTFDGKTTKILKPIGSTPVYGYDKDGNEKTETPETYSGVPPKPLYYKGGHYEPIYQFNGKNLSMNEIGDQYNKYKELYKTKTGKDWDGGLNAFLKEAIKNNQYRVLLKGENGTVDEDISRAAQRVISNVNTKKGQTEVFDTEVEDQEEQ